MNDSSKGYTGNPLSGNGLSKAYGKIQAVQDISLELPPGEVTVLLGLNGAGKSTLLNILSGALKPDAGEVHVGTQKLKPPMVGLCPQSVTLWPDLTPREQLELMGECHNIEPAKLSASITETLKKLQIF